MRALQAPHKVRTVGIMRPQGENSLALCGEGAELGLRAARLGRAVLGTLGFVLLFWLVIAGHAQADQDKPVGDTPQAAAQSVARADTDSSSDKFEKSVKKDAQSTSDDASAAAASTASDAGSEASSAAREGISAVRSVAEVPQAPDTGVPELDTTIDAAEDEATRTIDSAGAEAAKAVDAAAPKAPTASKAPAAADGSSVHKGQEFAGTKTAPVAASAPMGPHAASSDVSALDVSAGHEDPAPAGNTAPAPAPTQRGAHSAAGVDGLGDVAAGIAVAPLVFAWRTCQCLRATRTCTTRPAFSPD